MHRYSQVFSKIERCITCRDAIMDHHVHTRYCRHATGEPEDYVKAAIAKGLPFIGFNEHFPMRYLPERIPVEEYAMEREEFPAFLSTLKELREKYQEQIGIKISTEVDYFKPAISTIRDWLSPHMKEFDYIYGAVHVVTDWAVDDTRFIEVWKQVGTDHVYSLYWQSMKDMVESGLFDMVAHVDLPKKFEKFPERDFNAEINELLDAINANHMTIEVNTAGLRKPVHEIYPSKEILGLCYEKGIPVTLGSDAHAPDEIGYAFPDAIAMLKEIGYDSIRTFSKREPKDLPI